MKNIFSITEKEEDGTRYLHLDTARTTFRNFQWQELGDWGKRKCENMIVLSNMNDARKRVEVIYV